MNQEQEIELLDKASLNLPLSFWNKYNHLKQKRQDETLTALEHQELINLSDQLEIANATRMPSLIQSAQLRGISLETLLAQIHNR